MAAVLTAIPTSAASATSHNPLPRDVPKTFIGQRASKPGAGIYSSNTGRLIRRLGSVSARPVAISNDDRSVFAVTGETSHSCVRRIDLSTGRSRPLKYCATNLAISHDGRMLAYTRVAPHHPLTSQLVIHDRRTGLVRTLLLQHNCKGCMGQIDSAALAWSPDDRHLAVSVATTAAIAGLQVLNAHHGTLTHAPSVIGCRHFAPDCLQPVFDNQGQLIFSREVVGGFDEVRREHGRLSVLFRFPAHSFAFETASNRSATAFLWFTPGAGFKHPQTDAWVDGHIHVLFRGDRARSVIPVLWDW